MKKIKNNNKMSADTLSVDESFRLHKTKGNGILRRQIWVNLKGEVTRYNLAYINHNLHAGDNGRVLGYDNAHGYHHKHYMGIIQPIKFTNFQTIEEQFQSEFEVLHEQIKRKH